MKLAPAYAVALALALPAAADEGMWTYNGFPRAEVQRRYGFDAGDAWLEKVRLSAARLGQGGCSASFVSPDGLVMTNHHCVRGCIEQLSSAEHDHGKNGFYARTAAEELRCPVMAVDQLLEITDVTARMGKATAGKDGRDFADALRAEIARTEKECQAGERVRCEVVTLFRGGHYDLYKYRRYPEVRLVWAPEQMAAHFGGDPDNFNFPRWALDAAFVRVWEDGKPAAVKNWFPWSAGGAREGELVFVPGNPGSTGRLLTVAQLEYQRDVALPERLLDLAELRGLYGEYQRRGPEQARHSTTALLGAENGYKALLGRREALLDKAFFAGRVEAEARLRAGAARDPELARSVPDAFQAISAAQDLQRVRRKEVQYVAGEGAFASVLFHHARVLLRAPEELPKPNGARLHEFQEAGLPALRMRLFSRAPIHEEFEILKLEHSLGKLRERLGADHPFVRKVLGKESPEALARRLVQGTRLRDPAERRRLWEGGKAAVEASDDPMLRMARLVDADARSVRRQVDEEIDPVLKRAGETLARARQRLLGAGGYPDATFSPRISFGAVKGWTEGGRTVAPFTTFAGAFERDTGAFPFDLPPSFHAARGRLDLSTPYDFATTNDIIGGNSGSPVINQRAEIVGLIFDGNLPSLAGDYGYDEAVNRAVAVHSTGLLTALRTIYGADRLVEELTASRRASR
jgi:hypothetical protein